MPSSVTCSRCTFAFAAARVSPPLPACCSGLYPPAALLAVCAWLLTFYLTRTSSLAALIATPLTLPLLAWQEPAALLPMSALTGLIVWRHRGNLRDLFAGRERHF